MLLHYPQSQLLAAEGFLSLQGVTPVVRQAMFKEIPEVVVGLRGEKPVVLFSALLLMRNSDEAALTGGSSVYKPACSSRHFLPKG